MQGPCHAMHVAGVEFGKEAETAQASQGLCGGYRIKRLHTTRTWTDDDTRSADFHLEMLIGSFEVG